MTAHDQIRAMLDELMGTARDGRSSELDFPVTLCVVAPDVVVCAGLGYQPTC